MGAPPGEERGDLATSAVITVSRQSWATLFTGWSPRRSGTPVAQPRHGGADTVRSGRPWSRPLEDQVPLATACRRDGGAAPDLTESYG
ncbi:hypothetical protein [Streptomyces sp. NPDC003522]